MTLSQGSFTQVWSMSFGGGPGGSNPTCTSQEQRTITKSVSASASADVNFIFGKASASVTGGLSSSVTATFGATYPFHVPANKTYRCVYGIVTYNFQGTTTTQICGHGSCGAKQAGSFSGTGPQEAKWNYCDIRNTAACSVV